MKWKDIGTKEQREKIKFPDKYPTEDFVKLNLANVAKRKSDKSWFLNCPFHGEKDPSLSIIVRRDADQAVGYWRCFGCGKSGHWDDLATQLQLPLLDPYKADLHEEEYFDFSGGYVEDEENEASDLDSLCKWPSKREWRTFDAKTIKKFNGKLDKSSKSYPLVFVCNQRKTKRPVGVIRCREKKHKKYPSYLFSEGNWLSNFMWPEYTIKDTNVLMLVEGCRDALAWLRLGVPTCAILGTQSGISSKRFSTLLHMGIDNIVLFMDGDKAGKKCVLGTKKKEGIQSILEKDFDVQTMKTWKFFPGKDPAQLARDPNFVKDFISWIDK
jgi:hypothetical protein